MLEFFISSFLNYSVPCGVQGTSEWSRSDGNSRIVGGTDSIPGNKDCTTIYNVHFIILLRFYNLL